MFKKNAWVAGLLAALVIVLVGCVDALPPPEGEIVEVTRLSEIIKDAPLGVIKDDDAWSAIFADTPFMKCGPATFTIIDDGGVKKLKIDKMINTWGEGLDVRHAPTDAGNSGVNYKVGDEIYIKGTADPVGIFFNAKGGAYSKIGGNWSSDTVAFEKTITLTADDVADIKVGNPQTIRLHYDSTAGDSRRGVIIFEEIVVKGMRSAGDTIELPDFSVNNADAYNVNALKPAANEVYIDLAETVKFNLTPDTKKFVAYVVKGATADESGALYAKFSVKTDALFIPFTDEVRERLQTAAKNQFTFSVFIDGSTDSTAASTVNNVRWCFGQDTGSGWNISTMIGPTNIANAFKGTVNYNSGSIENMKGMVIQAGGGNVDDIAPYTVRINSIKVTLNPPTNAIGKFVPNSTAGVYDGSGSKINLIIPAPLAGVGAPTSVVIKRLRPVTSGTYTNTTSDDVGQATITWKPELNAGKWAVSTTYTASIVLNPNAGYYILPDAQIQIITVTGGVNSSPVDVIYYNPETRTAFTEPFVATESVIRPLSNGKIWDLDDWLANVVVSDSDNLYGGFNPIHGSGSANGTVTTAFPGASVGDKWSEIVVSGPNKGITKLSNVNYDCFDINLSEIESRLDPAAYKINVVVTGKVLALRDSAVKGKMKIAGSASPYNELAITGELGVGDTFTISIDNPATEGTVEVIPADFFTNGKNGLLRIQSTAPSSNAADITKFIVTGIEITIVGNLL